LFAVFCGWVHQRQTLIIEFQNDQITTMMEALGKKRLLLTDNQRRLLAVKGKAIGRKALLQLTTIVTPDTILGWHRKLVAEKWDDSEKRKSVGRPRTSQEIVDLILQFARENPDRGRSGEPQSPDLRSDCRQHPESARHRTGSKASHHMGHFPQGTLGCLGRYRLHDHGGLDA
jgi:hypothetical protein